MGYGGGQPNISQDVIRSMQITLPPKSEQQEIVNFLGSSLSRLDKVERIENQRIEKLKEYRQALISEVVTGKIKVTEDV